MRRSSANHATKSLSGREKTSWLRRDPQSTGKAASVEAEPARPCSGSCAERNLKLTGTNSAAAPSVRRLPRAHRWQGRAGCLPGVFRLTRKAAGRGESTTVEGLSPKRTTSPSRKAWVREQVPAMPATAQSGQVMHGGNASGGEQESRHARAGDRARACDGNICHCRRLSAHSTRH